MLARNPKATWDWSPESDPAVKYRLGMVSAGLENRVMAGCTELGRFNSDRLLNYTGELIAEGLREHVAGLEGVPPDLSGAALEPYVPMRHRASMAYAIFGGAQVTEKESD